MYYHLKLMYGLENGECKANLSEDVLQDRYLNPYFKGEPIVINGTTMDPLELWRVKITKTTDPLDNIIKQITINDSQDINAILFHETTPEWRAIDVGEDVTEFYIDKAPGSLKEISVEDNKQETQDRSNEKVFIVHGHDSALKNEVELFVRSIDLEPIVLHRQLDEGMTIIEKFEKHSDVKYALILLTPDDIGFSKTELKNKESDRKIEKRARQNVIFEFGFFVGKLSRKNVCCIFKEGVSLPSDLNGLIYKQVNNSIEEVGLFLMKELKNAGLKVKFE